MVSSVQPADIDPVSADELRRRDQDAGAKRICSRPGKYIGRLRSREGAHLLRERVAWMTGGAIHFARELGPGLSNVWGQTSPILLSQVRKLALLRLGSNTDANDIEEKDDVGAVLSEFGSLSCDQQDKVAGGLALLWGAFVDAFGGVSAFLAASPIEQRAYVEKLETAARRMETARGSGVAFHYVTVELMRLYVYFLQTGSEDPKAITLARAVAPLIDRGRIINADAGPSSANEQKAA